MDALQRLGIDGWSLVLYLVNYGILFLILGKFVYKPLTKAMDERSAKIRSNLEEAERLKKDFSDEMEKRSKESDDMLKQMQVELSNTRAEAEARAKELIAQAETKREELITQAYADVAAMKDKIVSEVERDLLDKIERIAAASMRSESVSAKTLSESVERAWDELKTQR